MGLIRPQIPSKTGSYTTHSLWLTCKTPSPYPTLDDGMHLVRSNTKEDVYFDAMALQMDWPTIPIMTTSFGKHIM